jgi:V/A-type H+/Na+-transporting ATPase subunit I
MRRVAVVTPSSRVRVVLTALADIGVVDLAGPLGAGEGPALEALRRVESRARRGTRTVATLAREAPDLEQLERSGTRDVLAGEVELERRRAAGVEHGGFALFVGWAPVPALASLADRLQRLDASLVELAAPRGQEPPTLLAQTPAVAPFRPLLDTYGAVPYEDVDPTLFTALTYCLMFGMMFGDVGGGLLIVLGALALRGTRSPRVRALRAVWPMLAAAGAAASACGFLYGEFFGPTGVVPTLWLAPLDDPTRLLVVAIVIGGCLLAAGQLLGIVNRWREGGARLAMTASSGVPGLLLLLAGALVVIGTASHAGVARTLGVALGVLATAALLVGLRWEAGRGAAAAVEVLVGLFDALLRMLSNVFSFSRLAAFGLMHAALGKVVLDAARGLSGRPLGDLAAAAVFLLGGAVAFALEAFVAAVQALRLEYYELFSRVFVRAGRPFRPWNLPLLSTKEAS